MRLNLFPWYLLVVTVPAHLVSRVTTPRTEGDEMRNGCDEDRSLKVTSFSIIICILMFLWAPIVRRGVRHREKEIETEPASRSPSHYDPRFECNMISFLQLESYFLSQGVSFGSCFTHPSNHTPRSEERGTSATRSTSRVTIRVE